jgi:hypothetical protein
METIMIIRMEFIFLYSAELFEFRFFQCAVLLYVYAFDRIHRFRDYNCYHTVYFVVLRFLTVVRNFYKIDVLKVGGSLLKNKRFFITSIFLAIHILQDVVLSLNTFEFGY